MRPLHLLRTLALVAVAAVPAAASGPTLLPSIGVDHSPADTERICPIPFVGPMYDSAGPSAGSPVHDFTLYSAQGEPLRLTTLLGRGRAVLLVAGSFSCPVFRSSIPTLNELAERYRSLLDIVIIYVVEAHPAVDPSPYFGVENVTPQNRYADILVRQPRTYGERRALVDSLLSRFAITPPVVIDGPCNEWWNAFGQAANEAVLLCQDGRIAAWHGWFDREPHDMPGEIERLLGGGVSEVREAAGGALPSDLRLD
jgi:hypothetical protein